MVKSRARLKTASSPASTKSSAPPNRTPDRCITTFLAICFMPNRWQVPVTKRSENHRHSRPSKRLSEYCQNPAQVAITPGILLIWPGAHPIDSPEPRTADPMLRLLSPILIGGLLLPRLAAAADPVISEFMASNQSSATDEDGSATGSKSAIPGRRRSALPAGF